MATAGPASCQLRPCLSPPPPPPGAAAGDLAVDAPSASAARPLLKAFNTSKNLGSASFAKVASKLVDEVGMAPLCPASPCFAPAAASTRRPLASPASPISIPYPPATIA
jgi:hypothetical protein